MSDDATPSPAPEPRAVPPRFLKSPLTRFVLAALLWLPAMFAAWYLLGSLLLAPVRLLVQVIARTGFGDIVRTVESAGSLLTFVTTLKPGEGVGSGVVSVDVNMLVYAFGLPFFAALTLAAREAKWWRTLLLGYAVMVPFIAWGVLADFLKQIAIYASPAVASQTGFSAWQREMIAFAYQFGALILPAVVPAVLWVLLHRAYLERLRLRVP